MQISQLKRREFITLLGGTAVAWPLVAQTQQAMPVVGFLGLSLPDVFADRLRGFQHGLKETGYVEGENVAIEYRWAENQKGLAAELARRRKDSPRGLSAVVGMRQRHLPSGRRSCEPIRDHKKRAWMEADELSRRSLFPRLLWIG
jgi:hypothetical protein